MLPPVMLSNPGLANRYSLPATHEARGGKLREVVSTVSNSPMAFTAASTTPKTEISKLVNGVATLDLPLKSIISNTLLDKVFISGREEIPGGTCLFDEKYNAIRFYLGNDVVNIWLKDKAWAEQLQVCSRERSEVALLTELEQGGVLAENTLVKLGISENEAQSAAKTGRVIAHLHKDSVDTLPDISLMTERNIGVVLQGEMAFISPADSKIDGLFTGAALNSSIMISTFRNYDGDILRIGLSQVDESASYKSLNDFFKKMTVTEGGALATAIISGTVQTVLKIASASEHAGAKITFSSPDSLWQRIDSAGVNIKGEIFYGVTGDLIEKSKNVSAERIERMVQRGYKSSPGLVEQRF